MRHSILPAGILLAAATGCEPADLSTRRPDASPLAPSFAFDRSVSDAAAPADASAWTWGSSAVSLRVNVPGALAGSSVSVEIGGPATIALLDGGSAATQTTTVYGQPTPITVPLEVLNQDGVVTASVRHETHVGTVDLPVSALRVTPLPCEPTDDGGCDPLADASAPSPGPSRCDAGGTSASPTVECPSGGDATTGATRRAVLLRVPAIAPGRVANFPLEVGFFGAWAEAAGQPPTLSVAPSGSPQTVVRHANVVSDGVGLVRARVAGGPWETVLVPLRVGRVALRRVRFAAYRDADIDAELTFCGPAGLGAGAVTFATALGAQSSTAGATSATLVDVGRSDDCVSAAARAFRARWRGRPETVVWHTTEGGRVASHAADLAPWRLTAIALNVASLPSPGGGRRVVTVLGSSETAVGAPVRGAEVEVRIVDPRFTVASSGDAGDGGAAVPARTNEDGALLFDVGPSAGTDPDAGRTTRAIVTLRGRPELSALLSE